MRLFILYDVHTKEWDIVIQNNGTVVVSSVFTTNNPIHAMVMAMGYLAFFTDMIIDPTSELVWRQLGLKTAPMIAAMQ